METYHFADSAGGDYTKLDHDTAPDGWRTDPVALAGPSTKAKAGACSATSGTGTCPKANSTTSKRLVEGQLRQRRQRASETRPPVPAGSTGACHDSRARHQGRRPDPGPTGLRPTGRWDGVVHRRSLPASRLRRPLGAEPTPDIGSWPFNGGEPVSPTPSCRRTVGPCPGSASRWPSRQRCWMD